MKRFLSWLGFTQYCSKCGGDTVVIRETLMFVHKKCVRCGHPMPVSKT